VDLQRRHPRPIRRPLDFAAFFLFFPRMISSPIVRPADFLAQLEAGALRAPPPVFRSAELFLVGVVFKAVIAESSSASSRRSSPRPCGSTPRPRHSRRRPTRCRSSATSSGTR
jgi:D-alanyl-lipoteichoic acid acyltransferase DltB (MBOAT superfamily)